MCFFCLAQMVFTSSFNSGTPKVSIAVEKERINSSMRLVISCTPLTAKVAGSGSSLWARALLFLPSCFLLSLQLLVLRNLARCMRAVSLSPKLCVPLSCHRLATKFASVYVSHLDLLSLVSLFLVSPNCCL